MAHRSFDSVTRFDLVQVPPRSLRGDHHGEQFADEGTLILAPSVSVAPPSVPPPPSSVRPPMPSWDDRVWSVPVSERTGTTSISEAKKKAMSARDRSASAMLAIATAAMLAAFASIGFMRRADRHAAEATVATVATSVAPESPAPPAATPAAPPPAADVAPPVAIDIDDVRTPPRPVLPKAQPQPQAQAPVAAKAAAAPAPVPAANAKAKARAENAPPRAAQEKALEDLLEQLGEEQLKR